MGKKDDVPLTETRYFQECLTNWLYEIPCCENADIHSIARGISFRIESWRKHSPLVVIVEVNARINNPLFRVKHNPVTIIYAGKGEFVEAELNLIKAPNDREEEVNPTCVKKDEGSDDNDNEVNVDTGMVLRVIDFINTCCEQSKL